MSEQCERMSKRRSEWPSTLRVQFIDILRIYILLDVRRTHWVGIEWRNRRRLTRLTQSGTRERSCQEGWTALAQRFVSRSHDMGDRLFQYNKTMMSFQNILSL